MHDMPEYAVGLRIPLARGAQAEVSTACGFRTSRIEPLGCLLPAGSLHGVAACGSLLRP